MFKKPPNDVKTSAPLRNSDRRKLRQRIALDFSIPQTDADTLVPDGVLSIKISTYAGQQGLVYISPDGDPLWFSIGKGNTDLIPSVYTLWAYPTLLKSLYTPQAVIPILTGGADLMIPGVFAAPSDLRVDQLVSVRTRAGAPLAIGRMAVDSSALTVPGAHGKAALILHVYKDKLWEMGSRSDPPEIPDVHDSESDLEPSSALVENPEEGVLTEKNTPEGNADGHDGITSTPSTARDASQPPVSPSPSAPSEVDTTNNQDVGPPPAPSLNPQEVSALLRTSLLQAIGTTLSALPSSAFPLPATTFYTAHLLPARPFSPSGPDINTVTIKHAAHKNLAAFLRAGEKEDLLKLKDSRGSGDVLIIGVNAKHPDVIAHTPHRTVGEEDARRERQAKRALAAAAVEAERMKEVRIEELWKPHLTSIRLFEVSEKDSSALYSSQDVRTIVNAYVTAQSLVNARQQQYVNIDPVLGGILATKGEDPPEFVKRDKLAGQIIDKMQPWYRVEVEGKDTLLKKGKLQSILINVQIRRKACTLVTRFEPFFVDAASLAEELRHVCASSTAVAPIPGVRAGSGEEVMVQGRHIQAVTDVLISKGVPKKWIEAVDSTGKSKKK